MAIADMMGWKNPLTSFVGDHRQALIGLGTGLMNGKTFGEGMSQGIANAGEGRVRDDAYATQQKAEAERLKGINQTVEYMRQKGYNDLVAGVEGGGLDVGTAWGEALKRSQPGYGQAEPIKPVEVNGQLVNPITGQVIGDYRSPEAPPSAPSGYQWTPEGTQTYIPGGPADPAFKDSSKPLTDAQRRANSLYTVIEPDAKLLLGDPTTGNPGIFDNLGDGGSQAWSGIGVAGINPLAGLASGEFQAAKDAVTSIAQNYLYAVSGQAAPAEEVKKIADLVTPNPMDSPARKAEKRRRLETYIAAIQQSTVQPGAATNDGWEVIGVQ